MKRGRFLVVLLLISLAIAISSGSSLYLRLAYFFLITLALSGLWAWVGLRWLRVGVERRTLRSQVGRQVEETITVENRGRLPKGWLEVQDQANLPGGLPASALALPARGSQSWVSGAKCQQRGLFSLGPVAVVSEDPFGLFRLRQSFGPSQSLLVYPATVDLPQFHIPPADLPGESPQRHRTFHVTPNAYTTRDYTPGDSFNRVHWRSTARWGKLMVKEFEHEPSSDVWILLDMYRGVQVGEGRESTEEYGVTIAASIAKKFLEANYCLGLATRGDENYLISPERGPGQMARVMEALALVRAQGTSPLMNLLAATAHRLGRRTTAVLITPSSEVGLAEGLNHFWQRKVKLAAVFIDGSTFGGRRSPRPVVAQLAASSIPAILVRRGDDLPLALSAFAHGAEEERFSLPGGVRRGY